MNNYLILCDSIIKNRIYILFNIQLSFWSFMMLSGAQTLLYNLL